MDYQVLYELISASIEKQSINEAILNEDINWQEIYEEFMVHKIMYLPLTVITPALVQDQELYHTWKNKLAQAVWYYTNVMRAQSDLKKLLDDNGILFVILKGSAVSRYYPNPMLRTTGDIDFLVQQEDYDRTCDLMTKNGYIENNSSDKHERHREFVKASCLFEIHQKVAGLPFGKDGEMINKYIVQGISEIQLVDVDNYQVPVLPVKQNGIVLLLHIIHHLHSGIGYRQIIDWAVYAEHEISEQLWQNELYDLYKKFGLANVAKVLTKMSKLHFGICKSLTWCDDIQDEKCHELFEIISASGNFGRKKGDKTRVDQFEISSRNPILLIKFLQNGGEVHWKLLKRYPILSPLAWIYQSFRYVRIFFNRFFHDREKLRTELIEGKKKKELFDYLGIYNYLDD